METVRIHDVDGVVEIMCVRDAPAALETRLGPFAMRVRAARSSGTARIALMSSSVSPRDDEAPEREPHIRRAPRGARRRLVEREPRPLRETTE